MGNKIYELEPVYVEYMPEVIEEGKLYVSKKFGLTIHLCACGCGVKTPLPVKGEGIESDDIHQPWIMTMNGDKITLSPSIGNFIGENPYHAHYFIRDNKIVWC